MKNGIYEASFTTNQGTLGVAAVLIQNGAFVGADGVRFYRGEIETGENISVIMEVTRHNFGVESAFGSEAMFTLTWVGEPLDDATFKLSCEPPGLGITIYVVGKLIKDLA